MEMMMGKYDSLPVGYVDSRTGRVAVLASDYADSDLNGDAPAYRFSRKADEYGMDPWRRIDGVDRHTHGTSMDLWFANGSSETVGPLMTIFLAAADADRLKGA